MKVLLTGGAGFIGTHVLARLRERDHEVVVLDSLRPDVHGDSPTAIDGLVRGDVRDAAVLDDVLPGTDVVVHLAAKVGLGVDVQDLPDYADSNVHGTAALLAAMARAGVGRLVLAGSMVAYGEGLGRCATHGEVAPAARVESELAAAGLTIDPEAKELLLSLLGQDRLTTRSELDKLATYAHGVGRVGVADVESIVADASALVLDHAVDGAFSGDVAVV
ncbi:NAD-dependent epimerase/dehydratase family protein, partial [Jatrophihabitans endophyticus]|uniref:NAD-dependent epimerase/dehydratase family protein n=1 Tax=Jatrophihabitans endophyticus TaxID=1206085 RepID=UPI0019E49E60